MHYTIRMPLITEEKIEKEFHISWFIIAYKMAAGLVEFFLGAGILLFGRRAFVFYQAYMAGELAEDPHDLIMRMAASIIPAILTHRTLAVYLIVLGAAKIAGAVGLLYQQTWGVDLLVSLTLIFFPFQLVRFLRQPTLADFLYIVIGLVIALYLINFKPHEWARKMLHRVRHRNK